MESSFRHMISRGQLAEVDADQSRSATLGAKRVVYMIGSLEILDTFQESALFGGLPGETVRLILSQAKKISPRHCRPADGVG